MLLIDKIKRTFFPFYRNKNIKKIFDIINFQNKTDAMLVGGCVRKYLQNESIDDIDIATVLTPSEVIQKFSNSDFEVKKTGIEHGTLTLVKDGQSFEVTTLREDVSTDGRHARVLFTKDWKKDSERRDFTINAIYLDKNGKVFDPQNGFSDLKHKNINFIGDPDKRIKEDYLRILRFIRFSIQYSNFQINEKTLKAIQLNLDGIIKLSKERIYNELKKILNLRNFVDIFQSKDLLLIVKLIFPEFRHLDRIKKVRQILGQKFIELDKDIILALLLVDHTDNHNYFSHKYKVSNEVRSNLNFYAIYFNEIKKNKNFLKKDLKKNIFYHGKKRMKLLILFYYMTLSKFNLLELKNLILKTESISLPRFPITGKYLLEKGLRSGKKIGQVIKEIEKKWIENDFNLNDEELKSLLKKYI